MKAMLATVTKLYNLEIWVLGFFKHPFLLIVRLYFGWKFMVGGLGKLENIQSTTAYFSDLHIPMPTLNAYMAGGTETICGALLVLGFASRVITIPLIVTMIVAYCTAHRDEFEPSLFDSDNLTVFVKQPPFAYLYTCLVVLLFGPGYFSVDGVLKWLFGRHRCPKDAAAVTPVSK